MPGLGMSSQSPSTLLGQHHLVVGLERRVVASRGNKRHVRPHKTHAQPERLVLVLFDQFHRLGCRLAVGMDQVVAIGFDDDKRIAADDRSLAVGVALQRFAVARGLPLGPWLLNRSVQERASSAPSSPFSIPPGTPM